MNARSIRRVRRDQTIALMVVAAAVLIFWSATSRRATGEEPNNPQSSRPGENSPFAANAISPAADFDPAGAANNQDGNFKQERLREGSPIIERVGRFIPSGGGLVFQSTDNKLRLTGLANLNLERIARAVQNSADPLEWTVSGEVTEYRGNNYLLITKALFRHRINKP